MSICAKDYNIRETESAEVCSSADFLKYRILFKIKLAVLHCLNTSKARIDKQLPAGVAHFLGKFRFVQKNLLDIFSNRPYNKHITPLIQKGILPNENTWLL